MPTLTLAPPAPTVAMRLTITDRCNAQAFIEASNATGLTLLLCGHHGRAHEAKLLATGFVLHDETARINTAASASSA